jgi:hypothetical protein
MARPLVRSARPSANGCLIDVFADHVDRASRKQIRPDVTTVALQSWERIVELLTPLFRMVSAFGAKAGDLVLAINVSNDRLSAAVIGDVGPAGNLGEGSIALNMALLGRTVQPKNYKEAKTLDTGAQEILVVIIPGSRNYKTQKPFAKQNIESRLRDWQMEAGFATQEEFIQVVKACQTPRG